MNRSHYWVVFGTLLLSLSSCSSHSERANIREEILTRGPIEGSEAERNEVLWSARGGETKPATSLAETRPSQGELEALNGGESERGVVLTLNGGVLFETDEADVEPGPRIMLDRLAAFMKRNPERNLLIEGHTDSTGKDQYNLVLSLNRANAVRRSLVARGIEESRMHTKAMGENFPVASNNSYAGRKLNRRVEIVLSDEDGMFSPAAERIAALQ